MTIKISTLLLLTGLFWSACTSPVNNSTPEQPKTEPEVTTPTKAPSSTNASRPTVEEIKKILIGDWIEDSIEFKKNYNMPPPPVQNTRVRYQEDGFVYIPGVLLAEEHWDKWEVANDSTLHIIKRKGYGVRVCNIDSIGQDLIRYRLQTPSMERKITLLRIKNQ
ncbi:hypothetical protein [Aureispira anguillae]|uniref:Lipoprotein n=1 Tax=Aureispira anguillae TaxID=2864201 RepID=A0A915YAV0_9BACT|nr:hypothetical protein [Aureispira anguillae]BDS09721.1 hypothetical protein AsAng_0004260 [Aureispira anguillae]